MKHYLFCLRWLILAVFTCVLLNSEAQNISANFTYNYLLSPGNHVQFTDASAGFPTGWIWSFGDGTGSTLKNPTKFYPVPLTYTVCLTAFNAVDTDKYCGTVNINAGNPNINISNGPATACTGNTITLNAAVTDGSPPYSFYWSNTANNLTCTNCQYPQTTLTQNATYTVTVVDGFNTSVTASVSYTVLAGNNTLQISATSNPITCVNTNSVVSVSATGGTAPYTYMWDNNSAMSQATQYTFTNPGPKVITVTDASGCKASVVENIAYQGISVNVNSVQPTCYYDSTGQIQLSASGGTAPYNYSWSYGHQGNTYVNIPANLYHVTVTDHAGCNFEFDYNLQPLNGWGYYVYTQPVDYGCTGNGQVNTTMYGGVAPYSYVWSNGSTQSSLPSVGVGTYTVTVTDNLGCTAWGSASVSPECYSTIRGKLFTDADNNCSPGPGEGFSYKPVTAQKGNYVYYGFSDQQGNYSIAVNDSGTYQIQVGNSYNCDSFTFCNPAALTVNIATKGDTVVNDIGFDIAPVFDIQNRFQWMAANPGFTKTYKIIPTNHDNDFNGTATVTFTYDTNLIFQSGTFNPAHNLAAHTLTWTVSSFNFNLNTQFLESTFLVPANLSLTTMLHNEFSILPTANDCDPLNNYFVSDQPVTGSYDPNAKEVVPAGNISVNDETLTYTIHFQNTGTDSTHFVILKDTLSPYLDPASVEPLVSSHPYTEFSLSGTGILTWTFNPLRLVDSATDAANSKGFVMFRIRKKSNLPVGTVISNRASIYFDYNSPILTNSVSNTIVQPNGVNDVFTNGISVKAYPNPFSARVGFEVQGIIGSYQFEMHSVTGQLFVSVNNLNRPSFSIECDHLPAGMYIYSIIDANGNRKAYGKLLAE